VNVYLRDGDVLLCDMQYLWDIAEIVGEEDRKSAQELTKGKRLEPPHDLVLCGQVKVTVDDAEFYKHLLESAR